jgi:predicted dehydrogenase
MFRIGIIGTENSHAMAFARLINLPDDATGRRLWEDAKVVGVYGPDLESAQAVYQEGRADFIAESPDDFIGRVDEIYDPRALYMFFILRGRILKGL